MIKRNMPYQKDTQPSDFSLTSDSLDTFKIDLVFPDQDMFNFSFISKLLTNPRIIIHAVGQLILTRITETLCKCLQSPRRKTDGGRQGGRVGYMNDLVRVVLHAMF